jgi:hypothetical protein
MKKQIFTITLLIIGLCQLKATGFAGGDGTSGSPYQVANATQLDNVRNHPDKYFIQTADTIYLNVSPYNTGAGWEPIGGNGTDIIFTGSYNGNGKTIANLTINRGGTANVGLFGHIGEDTDGVIIKNLKLTGVNVVGGRGTGSLVGRVTGDQKTRIEQCSAIGVVQGDAATGGLVGSNNSSVSNNGAAEGFRPVIYNCWANVNVSLRTGATEGLIKFGGLAGCNQKGLISNSYSRGSVTVDNANAARVGGIAGCVEFRGIIINSYATGVVKTHTSITDVGGLLGNIGTGNNMGTVTSCYYDGQIQFLDNSTRLDNTYGIRRTSVEMKNSATKETIFPGWDFVNIWGMDGAKNDGYPYLLETEPTPTVWIWVGGISGNPSKWDLDGNWNMANFPPTGAVVSIPNVTYQPIIPIDSTTLYKLTLASGATLDIPVGTKLKVTGTIVSSETEPIPTITGDGLLVLSGSTPQELPALVAKNITINNYNNVTLTGNLTVNGVLNMQNGLLDLNGFEIDLGENGSLLEIDSTNYSSRVYGNSGTINAARTSLTVNDCNLGLNLTFNGADPGGITIRRGHSELPGIGSSKSILRWFDIIPTNNDNLDATVVFNYVRGDLTYTGNEPSFSLFKKPVGGDSLSWVHVEATLDAANMKLTATGVQSFSTWTVASADTPMPIVLLSFDGKPVQDAVELSWVTAAEINNDYFTIERSTNGKDFDIIAYKEGAGTTSQTQYYSLTDDQPLPGLAYYRLKQTDYNGEFEYSKTITVVSKKQLANDIRIFPNPSNGNFNILCEGDQSTEYRIYDLQGRMVSSSTLEPGMMNPVSLPSLKAGIYQVVISGEETSTHKIHIL